jgi:hypothetical protein
MTTNHQTTTPVLTVHEATVQTVSIAIQTLRVGKKQVTMGLFRQLPYAQVVNWRALVKSLSGEERPLLKGPLWGAVNYWWADDHQRDDTYTNEHGYWLPHGEKRHLVWQDEETLCRSIVCEKLPRWLFSPQPSHWSLTRPGAKEELEALWSSIWLDITALPQLFIAV